MGKKIITRDDESSIITRKTIREYYLLKYYNIYMNLYDIEGLDYQQKDYLLKRLWYDGKVALYKTKINGVSVTSEKYPQGSLIIAPFAAQELNIYDFPVKVILINKRNIPSIPLTPLMVDEDVVIMYAQRNKRAILTMVSNIIEKICDVEMTLRTALKSQKMPWVVGYSPETEMQRRKINENLENDEPSLFMEIENINNFKALVSGAPYICDKLYALRDSYENELKEYFGVNNMGIAEKKEHLITGEINVNNEQVARSGECLFDCIDEGFERARDVLDYYVAVSYNKPEMIEEETKMEEQVVEEEKEDDQE